MQESFDYFANLYKIVLCNLFSKNL